MPLHRAIARRLFSSEPWWGIRAVVLGCGPIGQRVVKTMLEEPGLGLKPVAVVDDATDAAGDDPFEAPRSIYGVPGMTGRELALAVPEGDQFSHAVVAMPGGPSSPVLAVLGG